MTWKGSSNDNGAAWVDTGRTYGYEHLWEETWVEMKTWMWK